MRTFTCKSCGQAWDTEELGHFTICPSCKKAKEVAVRSKICVYRLCGKSFIDTSRKNSQKFCCSEHQRREKLFRLGKAQDASYFRDNKPKLNPICQVCGKRWKRNPEDKAVRCPECRLKARNKICNICGQPFIDDSIKNTRKAHPSCVVPSIDRAPKQSLHLEHHRFVQVRNGIAGRLDLFESLDKGTTSWWGRLSEEIFKSYRPRAIDINAESGSTSPFDFSDPELGRVNVKGAKGRLGPEGRTIWTVGVERLKKSCEHIFIVGYSANRATVDYLWLLPISSVNDRLIRFAPGSREYIYGQFDISLSWGLVVANQKLQWALALPNPVRPSDKFAWMDDSKYLFDKGPGHRGRKGELLYKQLYPESKDINREIGSTALYDFLDSDGIRVNVKISKIKLLPTVSKWSFARGFLFNHNCDLYSCLCLDASGQLIREYRIPINIWGDRRVIHIRNSERDQWLPYLIPLKKEGLRIVQTIWSEPTIKNIEIDQATILINGLDFKANDIEEKVLKILRKVPFPIRDYEEQNLGKDWEALVSNSLAIEGDIITGNYRGLKLCDAFFQHRYDATYKDMPSVRNAWEDESWLLKAIRFQLKVGDPLRPWNILRALRALVKTPSNFRPTIAKSIAEKYCPSEGLVLDPCAGYGGRAVGILAANRRYLGVDPHSEAVKAFKNLFNFLGANESQASVINFPFETVNLEGLVADCVFTSPPYFSIERYAISADQSWVKYPTWETWRDNFLKILIVKSYQHLRSGGVFCLNISDARFGKKVYPLIDESIRFSVETGFRHDGNITMILGRFGKTSKTEPILVFKKD
jgi:hypothetical protein